MLNNNVSLNSSISSKHYWQNHITLKRNSGLSRIEYCRKNNLILCQLKYRENKLISAESNSTKLLLIKLISDEVLPKEFSKVVNGDFYG